MKLLLIVFLLCGLLTPVRADGWDDFSNNLATDLAPFLALFGEQTTKQYLSESITLLDYYIFSIAPIGILTAVISAIRVCGSPSLRAFIGRAQEGGGDAEAELCSSTSRDVCELYNNGGIARVFGRPKILEIVHDPSKSADDTAGIYPCREFVRRRPDEWTRHDKSVADASVADETVADIFAPNLSLNIGIKRQSIAVSWAVAVFGTLLQLGVLVFAVVVTYYLKWQKDGQRPDSYACPMAIVGTLVEWAGMFLCALLVGQTSRKQVFHRNQQNLNKLPTQNAQTTNSSIYWVQPGGQVLGDQVFDPFCHSDHEQPLLQYVTSWKKPSKGSDSALVLWAAVSTTIIGFVLQFVGLRGIHSAVSVAQLGAMMLMSMIRSALRMQRLKPDDNFLRQCPDEVVGHELDWLALRLGSQDAPPDSQRRLLWRFCGARDSTCTITKERPSTDDDLGIAGKLLAYRTRLAQLTQSQTTQAWAATPSQQFDSEMVQVREISQCLALAIESTVNKIFSRSSKFQEEWRDHTSIFWGFACDVVSAAPNESSKLLSRETIYLQLTRGNLENSWKLQNKLELEGILGLWAWSLKSDPAAEISQGQFAVSRATEIPTRRIVSTKKSIEESGLQIWFGNEMPISLDFMALGAASERRDPSAIRYGDEETRFFGWHTADASHLQGSTPLKIWSAPTNSPLLSLCAQEVFGSFVVSIIDIINLVKDINIREDPDVRLASGLISEIITLFTEAQLGSREDALLCILPPMTTRSRILSAQDILTTAKIRANEHRRHGRWIKAEAMLKWAWDVCNQPLPQTIEKNPQHHTDDLVQQAAIALGELYRWAMTINDMKKFSSDGIKWLSSRKSLGQGTSTAVEEIIDRYIDIEDRVNRRDINIGNDDNNLTSTLLQLTLPASGTVMTEDEKGRALCSAAALGWSEVVIALLELGASPDYRDESKRYKPALSLAAESNSIEAVEELIRWGASPLSEDDFGRTPLSQAAEAGHVIVVKLLLDAPRVDPNVKDSWGDTPLMLAAWKGHHAVAQLLLDTGKVADLNSPLWYAVQKGHEAVFQVLFRLDHVDLNKKNSKGKTLLMLAAEKGHKAIAQLLLDIDKVDVDAKDINGKTALLYAEENGQRDIVQILQKRLSPPKQGAE
ncbi:hypothetical protein HDV63DRAFT_120359 [Trichoderma sp. SZMC 28014]